MKPLKGHTGVGQLCWLLSRWNPHRVGLWGQDDPNMGCEDRRGGHEASQGTYTDYRHLCWLLSRWEPHRVGLWDKTIRIWDARTGEEVMKPLEGHTRRITSVGFSPDGTHIVSGSWDNTIRIWDARTGEEVMKPLKGHTDDVTSVGFSPDGTHIVSGSGTIRSEYGMRGLARRSWSLSRDI
jgi:WD40 repeat protein